MLTREQFMALRQKGLTPDQIARFERGETPNAQTAKDRAAANEQAAAGAVGSPQGLQIGDTNIAPYQALGPRRDRPQDEGIPDLPGGMQPNPLLDPINYIPVPPVGRFAAAAGAEAPAAMRGIGNAATQAASRAGPVLGAGLTEALLHMLTKEAPWLGIPIRMAMAAAKQAAPKVAQEAAPVAEKAAAQAVEEAAPVAQSAAQRLRVLKGGASAPELARRTAARVAAGGKPAMNEGDMTAILQASRDLEAAMQKAGLTDMEKAVVRNHLRAGPPH